MTSASKKLPKRTLRGLIAATTLTLTTLAATALAAPAYAAAEGASTTAETGAGTTAAAAPAQTFKDVPPSNQFYADINWLAEVGITSGFADGTFRPLQTVDRQTMSAFLYRLMNPGKPDPVCTKAPFKDVPVSHPFCGPITWMADQEISIGFTDGNFRPGAVVSREIGALFLARAAHATPRFCVTGPFVDVPANYPYCSTIGWVAEKHIVQGWADGTFRPTELITRQAMAAFFHRFVENTR